MRSACCWKTAHARDPRCLEQYGVASFAALAAEYVHCLWHDVTIRTGEAYLPAPQLRRRLELTARFSRQTADVPCPRSRGSELQRLWSSSQLLDPAPHPPVVRALPVDSLATTALAEFSAPFRGLAAAPGHEPPLWTPPAMVHCRPLASGRGSSALCPCS
jgi:hypothetical protein